MAWPVALVLITLVFAVVGLAGLAVHSGVQENRRLMRALFARREYASLEARDTGVLMDDGVPPGMM